MILCVIMELVIIVPAGVYAVESLHDHFCEKRWIAIMLTPVAFILGTILFPVSYYQRHKVQKAMAWYSD
jgi:uncharacterized membrane protein